MYVYVWSYHSLSMHCTLHLVVCSPCFSLLSPCTHIHTCVCAVCASCLQAAELRKKNSEYQKRSRGTFFSGEYLDWLEAQQQDLLETASNGLLSSLSCASSCSCPIEGSQDGEEPVRVNRRVGGWVHMYVRTYVHAHLFTVLAHTL